MSRTVYNCCWLSVTVSPCPWSCCMTLTFSYDYWMSLTVSLVLLSCCTSLTVSYSCGLSFTVCPTTMELLTLSHCLQLSLAASLCLFQFLRVAACLSLSPTDAGYLSLFQLFEGDSAFLSQSPMVAGCLTLSLLALLRCCMSFTIFFGCLLSLTVSTIPWSCCMSLL